MGQICLEIKVLKEEFKVFTMEKIWKINEIGEQFLLLFFFLSSPLEFFKDLTKPVTIWHKKRD